MEPMLTAAETCAYLNIDYRTFQRLAKRDKTFPAYKVGGLWRVDPGELKIWCHSHQGGRQTEPPIHINNRLGRPPISKTRPKTQK